MHRANTGGSAASAKSVEAATSVGMGGSTVGARSVEGQAHVSMGGNAVGARRALAATSVSILQPPIMTSTVKEGVVFEAQPVVGVVI